MNKNGIKLSTDKASQTIKKNHKQWVISLLWQYGYIGKGR